LTILIIYAIIHLAMKTKLTALLVDLLLDCFCSLVAPAEHNPGIPVSARAQVTRRSLPTGGNNG
jgi:hypothetical protein